MLLLNGKEIANIIAEDLKLKISSLENVPSLVVIQVGNNAASNTYIKVKQKLGKRLGIPVLVHKFSEDIDNITILEAINFCNQDETVGGIIIQLPLPSHLNKYELLNAIHFTKDIDGLGLINAGKLLKQDITGKLPATPKGVITLLKKNNIILTGKKVVVIGRSLLVGTPLAILLSQENATVTLCHSHTEKLSEITREADILISAIGKPHIITKEFVKNDAIIVDVGSTFINGELYGDVDFEDVQTKVSAITPVPGGVGPMTVISLFQNLLGD